VGNYLRAGDHVDYAELAFSVPLAWSFAPLYIFPDIIHTDIS